MSAAAGSPPALEQKSDSLRVASLARQVADKWVAVAEAVGYCCIVVQLAVGQALGSCLAAQVADNCLVAVPLAARGAGNYHFAGMLLAGLVVDNSLSLALRVAGNCPAAALRAEPAGCNYLAAALQVEPAGCSCLAAALQVGSAGCSCLAAVLRAEPAQYSCFVAVPG